MSVFGELATLLFFGACLIPILAIMIVPWLVIAKAFPSVESNFKKLIVSWIIWIATLDVIFLFFSSEMPAQPMALVPLIVCIGVTLAPRVFDRRLAPGVFVVPGESIRVRRDEQSE